MGQEISGSRFRQQDFHQFERRLTSEMALLHEFFRLRRFAADPLRFGIELEAWLVDDTGHPQPRNEEFLEAVDSPMLVPELSRFNVEFNVQPQPLNAQGLPAMRAELGESWQNAARVAHGMDLDLAAIGILPTIRDRDLCQEAMSVSSRFKALNEQVLRLRRGRPLQLRIEGEETLHAEHHDVMLEAAATSLQLHLQVPWPEAVRYFNAAVIASAVVTGVSANSPLLFRRLLWSETRIPLFEQAVDIGGPFPRVSFGSGYAMESLEELFLENRACHPVLLPVAIPEPVEVLPHVRLHNGTIWRWNRPLIGFDDSGQPHLRIEHRVMPAGPTLTDMLANMTFACGLIHFLATRPDPPERTIPFETAFSNFYSAARDGLEAPIASPSGSTRTVRRLILDEVLGWAAAGLESLNISPVDADGALEIIAKRAETGQNGASWQREFVRRYGRDMSALTRSYLERQHAGRPVHEWDF